MMDPVVNERLSPLGVPAALREQGLSVIVPAFNEEEIIEASIAKVRETLEALAVPVRDCRGQRRVERPHRGRWRQPPG
jgi:hypothetical protein